MVLTTFLVTTTGDSGVGSLRQAILDSNTAGGQNTIDFSIGSGEQTISLLSALPGITVPVTIDGTSQPGYAGVPLIDLDGTNAGGSANGLNLATGSGGSTIRALVINNFTADGILITTTGNTVQSSYIGTNAAGTAAGSQPMTYGVFVTAGSNNTIGGTAAGAGNLISGNSIVGVAIENAGTTGNVVEGNLIGTNAAGTVAVPNTTGVDIIAASNTIGGTTSGSGNGLISGNAGDGVEISGTGATGNVVEGNLIGTDASGENALGNTDDGILLSSAPGNTIGGPTSASRNVIAADGLRGIEFDGANSNVVENNFIGTDALGSTAMGVGHNGIL